MQPALVAVFEAPTHDHDTARRATTQLEMIHVVHVPSSSGNLVDRDANTSYVDVILATVDGSVIEYHIPTQLFDHPPPTRLVSVIPYKHVSRFQDAFATQSYLQRFGNPSVASAIDVDGIGLLPSLVPSEIPTCSTLLFDLVAHPEYGMSSLLIVNIKGFDDGRMEFTKLLSSASSSVGDSSSSSSSDGDPTAAGTGTGSPSFQTIRAHDTRITSFVTFQSHESIFAVPLLVSGSLDGSVAVWEVRTSSLVFRLRALTPVLDLTRPILPISSVLNRASHTSLNKNLSGIDLELVAVVCADRSVRFFSIARMGWIQVLRGHDSRVKAIYRDDWCIHSDYIVIITVRHTIYIWSLMSGELEETLASDSHDAAIELLKHLPIFGGGNAFTVTKTSGQPRVVTPIVHAPMSMTQSPNKAASSAASSSPHHQHTRTTSAFQSSHRTNSISSGATHKHSSTTLLGSVTEGSSTSLTPPYSPSARYSHRFGSPSLSPSPSHSPPSHTHSLIHSTSRLSISEDVLTPPRLNRATTTSSMSDANEAYSTPSSSVGMPSAAAAPSVSSLPGLRTASWAVHYGLQRLWKLGGKGGLWSTSTSESQTNGNEGGPAMRMKPNGLSSNLICSFESLPSLQLNLFSIDIGYFSAEMKHSYAPLDAEVTLGLHPHSNASETQHRAQVYKAVIKLLLDWKGDDASIGGVTPPVGHHHMTSDAANVLAILSNKFHIRSQSSHGSLPTCFACYSPTNNAVSILLPRACAEQSKLQMAENATTTIGTTITTTVTASTNIPLPPPTLPLPPTSTPAPVAAAAAELVSFAPSSLSLAQLSRWSIGPNFTANQALCLTTVLLALIDSSDRKLHSEYSRIEAFYNATLPNMPSSALLACMPRWRYSEADIPFLSSYALHEHDDIRRASRLLIEGIISRMPLEELWTSMREWSSFYENLGSPRPPPLPWEDDPSVTLSSPSGTGGGSGGGVSKSLFPAPPRMVSDFEFMTCMILCYLYRASQTKRMRESQAASLALARAQTNVTHPPARVPTEAGAPAQVRSSKPATIDLTASVEQQHFSQPNQQESEETMASSVISLDATMFGLSGLKVEPSPKHHDRSKRTLLDADDSKHDAESSTSPVLVPVAQPPPPPLPLPVRPPDMTPWMVSTLIRLLAQTHQDQTLHSIQKMSICVELLTQGLTQPTRTAAQVAANEPEPINLFWQSIPISALDPLYRIIMDLSFVPPTNDPLAAPSTASATGDDAMLPPMTPQHALANNSRVLLYELAKWDVEHFVEWVEKEIFGYHSHSTRPSVHSSARDDPASKRSSASSVSSSAFTAMDPYSSESGPPALSLSTSVYATYKSQYFDEYRYQLVSVLSALPRKFAGRMSYTILKSMTELFIRVLDPLLVSQQTHHHHGAPSNMAMAQAQAHARSAQAQHTYANGSTINTGMPMGGGFLPLRGRLFTLLHPLFSFLALKYNWLAFSRDTMKLAVIDNTRWVVYERLGGGGVNASPNGLLDPLDPVTSAHHHALIAQPPMIRIYDLHTAAEWRTLEGHAGGSEIDCIAFSPNGHFLASYDSTDLPNPTLRVWSTDYESSTVGSGFLPTRFFMKNVLKVNPFCMNVFELPKLSLNVLQSMMQQRREHMVEMHGFIAKSGIVWKDAETLTLIREDDSVQELKL